MRIKINSCEELGEFIRQRRKKGTHPVTQKKLAGLTGVGPRFLGELENGKPTAQVGHVFRVLQNLGIDIIFEVSE